MTTREVLLRAAELIEERGHARGASRSVGGGFCVTAAISEAAAGAGHGEWWSRNQLSQGLMRRVIRDSLVAWNDRSSAATVIAGLRKAAEAAG